VEAAGVIDGQNLVVHEFVHKLDMLDGAANGIPPLHRWTRAFSFGSRRVTTGRSSRPWAMSVSQVP